MTSSSSPFKLTYDRDRDRFVRATSVLRISGISSLLSRVNADQEYLYYSGPTFGNNWKVRVGAKFLPPPEDEDDHSGPSHSPPAAQSGPALRVALLLEDNKNGESDASPPPLLDIDISVANTAHHVVFRHQFQTRNNARGCYVPDDAMKKLKDGGDAAVIKVTVQSGSYILRDLPRIPKPVDDFFARSLKQFIPGYHDVKFLCYDDEENMKPVFANYKILKELCPEIAKMPFLTFTEHKVDNILKYKPDQPDFSDSWDNDGDSDLDVPGDPKPEDGSFEKGDETADSSLNDDAKSDAEDRSDSSSDSVEEEGTKTMVESGNILNGSEAKADPLMSGRVICIGNVAHRTWSNLLFYLHTGLIEFAPLCTDEKTLHYMDVNEQYLKEHGNRESLPSCKSIFHLAKKLGLKDLEYKAFAFLKDQINERTIVMEIFSEFTSRYESVKRMELDYLMGHWSEHKNSKVLHAQLERVASGTLPHSAWLLTRLVHKIAPAGGKS